MHIKQLRSRARKVRKSLSPARQATNSKQASEHLLKQSFYQQSKKIAFFIALAREGEISPQQIMEHAWQAGKHCYLPVIAQDTTNKKLLFRRCTPKSAFELNRYGIAEPQGGELINPLELNLVITPLVAFDHKGNRIGMGGGFYDKTFANKKNQPQLWGLAHSVQQVDNINQQAWDLTLDAIVTELGVSFF